MVLGHRHGQRRAVLLPVGHQFVERDRIDHRARQDVRADLGALFEHADARARGPSRRPAVSAGSRRSGPPGPPPTITTSYCHRFAFAHGLPFVARVVASRFTHSTHPPCQFLDHGVNGGRGGSGGRGLESIGIGRGAQRTCLVARGGCRRRHPGRAAQLAEAACALLTPIRVCRCAEPVQNLFLTRSRPFANGLGPALRSRWPGRPPADPSARPRTGRRHAAERSSDTGRRRRRTTDRRRCLVPDERMLKAIGFSADQAYSASISCIHAPGARLGEQERIACAEIARKHVALARPQRLLLLGDGPCMTLLGKRLVERGATCTRSRACAPSPPSIPATSLIVP